MDIRIPTALLRDLAKDAARAVPSKTTLPVLEHLLITAEMFGADDGGVISVGACDMEIAMRRASSIEMATVKEPGSICVPAAMLIPWLDVCPGPDVQLRGDETELFVTSEQSNYRIMCLPPGDFPPFDDPGPDAAVFNVSCEEFIGAIQMVAYAVATDASRPVLQGVFFDLDGDVLTAVATDTHRVASVRLHVNNQSNKSAQIIVPINAIKQMLAVLPRSEGSIARFDIEEAFINCQSNGIRIRSRAIGGQFPNWRKVMPETDVNNLNVYVEAGVLEQSLKRILILAKDAPGKRISVGLKPDSFVVSADSTGRGNMVDSVKAEVNRLSDEGFNFGISCAYMLDLVGTIDPTRRIKMEYRRNVDPILITIEDYEDFTGILCVMQPDLL